MPPRYAYWTILIDQKPTAFRARDKEELLPTLGQLRRKNTDVAMKWFARGRLWDSPDQAEWAHENLTKAARPERGQDWRPGGKHQDPRDRFRPHSKHGSRAPSASAQPEASKRGSPTRESSTRESRFKPGRTPAAKTATGQSWNRPRPAGVGPRPRSSESGRPAGAAGRRPPSRPDRKRRN